MKWIASSLTRQFIFLLLLALIAGQTIPFAISWRERKAAVREASQSEFISRSSALSQLVEQTTPEFRREILAASATISSRFWTSPESPMDTEAWAKQGFSQLRRPLYASPTSKHPYDMRGREEFFEPLEHEDLTAFRWQALHSDLWDGPAKAQFFSFADADGMAMTMQLKDGSWLNSIYYKPLKAGIWRLESIIPTVITALVLCLIGAVIARLIARPLRQVAAAAEALGRGEALPILPETGPSEIRHLREAFNLMQLRLTRFVEDRTRMLAAIGHDLRTPLTTLRLRAEFIPESEARTKLIDTIDEIEKMTEATLGFAKGDTASEQTRVVDLNALVGSLCDDLAELGNDVTFEESAKTAYRCRPDGLKRAVRNLVENALRYGGKAMVHLDRNDATIDIVIEDQGPGIPDDQLERVFAPFYRLETSRNHETGGVGLGLSIARTIIHQHGGDIILSSNKPGLRATVALPNA